jgi:hypothetical protein
MPRKITSYDARRRALRNGLWPDSESVIYDKRDENGFCTVPRTLPLVATLLRHISANDPSRVYMELWFRQRDDGFVEVEDSDEMAAGSGYATGTRNVRTWREKLDELETLGFLRIKGKGNQKYRYLLLLHPHDVVQRIRSLSPEKIPEWWWGYFESRVRDIKADLRLNRPEKADLDFADFPGTLDESNAVQNHDSAATSAASA